MKSTSRLHLRAFHWLAMLLLGGQSMAGPVHVIFGREILGIPWTASMTEIARALPGGKWTGTGPRSYTVTDASTVFRVRRSSGQSIVVAMNDAGKIASVAIAFPNGTETHLDLLENLIEYLGEPAATDTTVTRDPAGKATVSTVWEDNGLRVTLVHSIRTPSFTRNEVLITRIAAIP